MCEEDLFHLFKCTQITLFTPTREAFACHSHPSYLRWSLAFPWLEPWSLVSSNHYIMKLWHRWDEDKEGNNQGLQVEAYISTVENENESHFEYSLCGRISGPSPIVGWTAWRKNDPLTFQAVIISRDPHIPLYSSTNNPFLPSKHYFLDIFLRTLDLCTEISAWTRGIRKSFKRRLKFWSFEFIGFDWSCGMVLLFTLLNFHQRNQGFK